MSDDSNLPDDEIETADPQDSQLERMATGGTAEDVVPPGHEYDGIKEYDNPIPPWLTYVFLATIAWSGLYVFGRIVGFVPSFNDQLESNQQALLETRMEAASNKTKISREMLVSAVDKPKRISEGETLFSENCKQCHEPDGGGMIGPNLTDNHWIHGGDLTGIYAVIRDGANNQKMPPWEGRLTQEEMISVTAYVRSLHGTTPKDPEPPEGDKWIKKDGKFVPADQS